MTIKIRAHHLICLTRKYATKGGWYDKKLYNYVQGLIRNIRENPNQKIEIKARCDDICKRCLNIKASKCNKASKYNIVHWIKVMDNKTIRLLKIKSDKKYKAKDLFNMAGEEIKNKDIKNICKGCEFMPYCIKLSINKSFIRDINK
jgi:hypothetical protein